MGFFDSTQKEKMIRLYCEAARPNFREFKLQEVCNFLWSVVKSGVSGDSVTPIFEIGGQIVSRNLQSFKVEGKLQLAYAFKSRRQVLDNHVWQELCYYTS